MTDVKLDDKNVIVEGEALQCDTSDIRLDSKSRRGNAPGEYRRALVHDTGDVLSINFDNDYTGGVRIEGNVELGWGQVTPRTSQFKVKGWDLVLDSMERRPGTDPNAQRRALVHDTGDTLAVNYDGDYAGGVRIDGKNAPVSIRAKELRIANSGDELSKGLLAIQTTGISDNQQLVIGNSDEQSGGVTIDSDCVAIGMQLNKTGAEWEGSPGFGGLIVKPSEKKIECAAESLCLNNPYVFDPKNPNVVRRALVHTENNQLVINLRNLYAEGVRIDGNVELAKITPRHNQLIVNGWDLVLDSMERRPGTDPNAQRRALVHDTGDTLAVNYDGDYAGGVRIEGKVTINGDLMVGQISLLNEIAALQKEIAEMQKTIEQLKRK